MEILKISALFCDDVRQEANGKHILVGVYPGDLISSGPGLSFPMSIWARLQGVQKGKHHFRLHIKTDDKSTDLSIEGEIDSISDEVPAIFAATGFPVIVNEPSVLRALISLDNEHYTEIASLKVSAARPPSAAV